MKAMLGFLIVGCFFSAAVSAGDLKIDSEQKFLMLNTTKTSTMQKELNEAASQGFRILVGGATAGTEMGIIMQRVDAPAACEYLLLATSKASTMQKELNEAGTTGYKVIPSSITFKERFVGPAELILVMERDPDKKKRYEYKLFLGSEKFFREGLMDEIASGYQIVALAMTPFAGAQVIAEKESVEEEGAE